MRTGRIGITVLALGLAAAAFAKAPVRRAAPAPAGLGQYATLAPNAYEAGRPWDDAGFKARLAEVLKAKAPLDRLYRGGPVVGPSHRIGDVVVLWACRAHDCSDVQAHVYIEPKANRLSLCWRDADGGDGDTWLTPGQPPEHLPEGACQADDRADAAWRAHAP